MVTHGRVTSVCLRSTILHQQLNTVLVCICVHDVQVHESFAMQQGSGQQQHAQQQHAPLAYAPLALANSHPAYRA